MFRRGEDTFKIKVVEENIFLVGMSVLHTKAEVGDRSRT
jgi:hypothetical protein